MRPPRVAVLGAGIMGSATALFAARRGAAVVLYDQAPYPFTGASRWNEGKIHLGFLYAGDPSMRTAERILPGGLVFRPLVEELIGCSLERITPTEDHVLIHRDSVVGPDAAEAYFTALGDRIHADPGASDYLVDVSAAPVRRLSTAEIGDIADPAHVIAGFVVPERSVSTQWVADRFVDALRAADAIELRMSTRVLGVDGDDDSLDSALRVTTPDGVDGPFDFVVNALWAGRPRIDSEVGVPVGEELSHRYRLALFIRTSAPIEAPSAVVSTGPFGDIKNYGGGEVYVSWYPSGLVVDGHEIDPPPLPELDSATRQAIIEETFEGLATIIPSVAAVRDAAQEVRLEGGWVFAVGRGDLSDPTSTLHRRDRIGITRVGSYFSVDTGKYSTAPWLARQVVRQIMGG